LAVDRKYKKEGEATADFISCVAFGKNGEFVEKYLHQGTKICVEGRIQTGSYTNKDGQKVYTTEIVVENHEFCESKGTGTAQEQPQASPDGFMNIPDGLADEGLPFD
jgi:single-strand DNA-binding protein